jgi:LPXTG-motif cell wall-anchored protein
VRAPTTGRASSLLPAAIALLVGGVVLLGRSRRRDGHVVVRRALTVLGAVAFLYVVEAGVLMGLYAAHRPNDAAERIHLGARRRRSPPEPPTA